MNRKNSFFAGGLALGLLFGAVAGNLVFGLLIGAAFGAGLRNADFKRKKEKK